MDSVQNQLSTKIASFSSIHIIVDGKVIKTQKQTTRSKIAIKRQKTGKKNNTNINKEKQSKGLELLP